MQTGRRPNPLASYASSCLAAAGSYSTPSRAVDAQSRRPRSSRAESPRPDREAGTCWARRRPRPPSRPARPLPCRPRRSCCRRRTRTPRCSASSRMARCSEAMVAGKRVDGDDGRDAVDLDVLDLLAEVGGPGQHVVGVLLKQLGRQRPSRHDAVLARMHLQRADGGHDHRGVGSQARGPALDVEEPLRAHVGAEARLCDQEVASVDADQVGQRQTRRRWRCCRRAPHGRAPACSRASAAGWA